MREITGTTQYEIGWWRRCNNEDVLKNGILDLDPSDKQTRYVLVIRSEKTREGPEHDNNNNAEHK